ncbi:MAG TPA: hypothetical protein VIJ40_00065 [Acidimicrobiales bacterium]
MTEANTELPSPNEHVASLRGAAAVSVGRRAKFVVGALGLIALAAVLVVSFLSVTNDNARIDRMKASGIPVTITVTNCRGNIGGSGSNSAGYTCRGDYSVGGATYHELIGSMATFSAPGTAVHGVADPSHHSTVALSSAVKSSKASDGAFVPLGLLTLVFVALSLVFLGRARRPTPPRRTPS